MSASTWFLALGILAVGVFLRIRTFQGHLPYPPGPPGLFGMGNLLDIPKDGAAVEYSRWSRKYNSDIVSWHMLGSHMVVLNSLQATKDLFEKRSSIYSSRHQSEWLKVSGMAFSTTFLPYSESWRLHRRVLQRFFRAVAVPGYGDIQTGGIRSVLSEVLDQPDHVVDHVKRYAGFLAAKLAYGGDFDTEMENWMKMGEAAMALAENGTSAAAVAIGMFPFLHRLPHWIPVFGIVNSQLSQSRALFEGTKNGPWNRVKTDMESENPPASLTRDLLTLISRDDSKQITQNTARDLMTTIHLGAADTSMSSASGALLALLLHPSVQARAQAELDEVVGRDRLPDFSDRASLPFIEATCREVLRWRVIAPLAPHAVTEDDVYNGYFIPKGSIVVGNSRAILHDPDRYPDPEAFRPERFITESGTLSDDDVAVAFGFGRRVCPGKHLARATLWVTVASLLSVFNIVHTKDKEGQEIEVVPEYSDGVVSHPLPFACSAMPRDAKAEALIRRIAERLT